MRNVSKSYLQISSEKSIITHTNQSQESPANQIPKFEDMKLNE